MNSGVPRNVDVMTWFGFLLRECARPYQSAKHADKRIETLLFVNGQSAKYVAEHKTSQHYFANGDMIYSDKIAKFVIECEEKSERRVTARLRAIYTDVFIDEFQDLAGWDLDVVKMLLQSGLRITLVGDPRQHIYSTNASSKNKQFLGIKLVDLVKKWKEECLWQEVPMSGTWRCNQAICNFTNALWPDMEPMKSLATDVTEHDGVFLVATALTGQYISRFSPQVLRYNNNAEPYGCSALNFGVAKGLQFNRVLIVPTAPIEKFLKTGQLRHVEKSKDKLHVAITRARHSVGFVYDGPSEIVGSRWVE
jgi:DNA helicase-2/ATP-dependent DNA helicase PcrA